MLFFFILPPPPPLHVLFRFDFCPKIISFLCLKTNASFPMCCRERKPCLIHMVEIKSVLRSYVNSLMTHHYLTIRTNSAITQINHNTWHLQNANPHLHFLRHPPLLFSKSFNHTHMHPCRQSYRITEWYNCLGWNNYQVKPLTKHCWVHHLLNHVPRHHIYLSFKHLHGWWLHQLPCV